MASRLRLLLLLLALLLAVVVTSSAYAKLPQTSYVLIVNRLGFNLSLQEPLLVPAGKVIVSPPRQILPSTLGAYDYGFALVGAADAGINSTIVYTSAAATMIVTVFDNDEFGDGVFVDGNVDAVVYEGFIGELANVFTIVVNGVAPARRVADAPLHVADAVATASTSCCSSPPPCPMGGFCTICCPVGKAAVCYGGPAQACGCQCKKG